MISYLFLYTLLTMHSIPPPTLLISAVLSNPFVPQVNFWSIFSIFNTQQIIKLNSGAVFENLAGLVTTLHSVLCQTFIFTLLVLWDRKFKMSIQTVIECTPVLLFLYDFSFAQLSGTSLPFSILEFFFFFFWWKHNYSPCLILPPQAE